MTDQDFDYFDSGFEEMVEDQKKEANEGKGFPTSYAGPEGTYIFRIYPEKYEGKPRMRRIYWANQIHKYKKVLAVKEDTRIKELLDSAEKKGFDGRQRGAWQHRPSKEGVLLAYLIAAPKHKNIKKAGNLTALVLDWRQVAAFETFMEEYQEETGESLKSLLDPRKSSKAIKMTISSKKENNKKKTFVDFTTTSKDDYELPKLSEMIPEGQEFEGLDSLGVPADRFLTEELFSEFQDYINKELKKLGDFKDANRYQPPSSSSNKSNEGGYKPSSSPSSEEQEEDDSSSNLTEDDCLIVENIQSGILDESDYDSQILFGNPPQDEVIECTICPNKDKCFEKAGVK